QIDTSAVPDVYAGEASVNDGSYLTGTKRRTQSKIAYLRKLLRPKLLKTPDEADQWLRQDPEKIAIISERLKAIVEKAAQEKLEFRMNPTEFAELRDALLDDLLGFG